ncbi:MAG: preprotein translocase subunit SecA [Phycisphaerales bacterium]|nr:preprotein translocase subunit SecA [Phycisphaerales bacterium]
MNFGRLLTRIFGSRNERLLKRYRAIVARINEMEAVVQPQSDAQLRARTQEIRARIKAGQLRMADVLPEAMAIIRESMDRHIGIRQIFNPEENFDPDQFDDEILQAYDDVQKSMIASGESWQRVPIPTSIYAAVRKLIPESRPPFRARCFDVQLIGGLVLYEGKIAEMATGEGKTFVAPLACFLRVLEGMHCHVVTVNDYLVRRDANWIRPAFEALGLSVGYIQSDMDPGGEARKRAYQCDVTYGTNSEFGFDYLRDNMKERLELQVQGPLDFAVIDEVDSILIDEARTPLIISGAAHDDAPKYRAADAVARKLLELHAPYAAAEREEEAAKRAIKAARGDFEKATDKKEKEAARKREAEAEKRLAEATAKKEKLTAYYEVEWDRKTVHMTHEGIAAAQEAAGVGSFYVGANMEWPHLMEQALRAHVVFERDKDYVVDRGRSGELEVIIVDEYTGRKMIGRQWSDGLHQAIEAKERVTIKQETQTLATITLQNFFKLYRQISGMTGTAMTESEEFAKIYKLEVVAIPTNRPVIRVDYDDRVYRTEREKWDAIIEEIKLFSDAGRPVLVGTTSVEKSEMLSKMLKQKYGIEHEVLNARYHEREAAIVAKAGQTHINAHGERVGNVTIATNMAGRGTDIKLAPEVVFEQKYENGKYILTQPVTRKVLELTPDDPMAAAFQLNPHRKVAGGLHVIGTERHTARRIDNQLRGRGGRQGDPGSSRFYVSLQDELMKLFAGEWTIKVLGFLGMKEGEAIEDKRISKGILRAQKKVEERNFLARKNLLEYDEVMDHQRTVFYGMRQKVLRGENIDQVIWGMIGEAIEDAVEKYVTRDYVAAMCAEWARANFEGVQIDPEDLRGIRRLEELEDFIKSQAVNEADSNISSTLGEFMGEDRDDKTGWDIKGLSSWAMSRFQVNLSQSQIRQMDAREVEEILRDKAIEQIQARDCSALAKYLEPNYALKQLCAWAEEKFGIHTREEEFILDPKREITRPAEEICQIIEKRARDAYALREIQYPVDHVLTLCFGEAGLGDTAYAAEYLRQWVKAKYDIDMTLEHILGQSPRKLREELCAHQEHWLEDGKLEEEVDRLIKSHPEPAALVAAFNKRFMSNLTADDLLRNARVREGVPAGEGARELLLAKARNWLRKELTDLEQFVLIQILDQSWKDHLYAMDMLKQGIGLHAFAERDPRVLYKKEGFRYFQEMMVGVRDKVTDLIFRARVAGPAPQARSRYQITAATHETQSSYGVGEAMASDSAGAAEQPQGEAARPRTIVRETPRVGRNDPCPCGSGKKYKKCCGVNAVT